MEWMSVELQNYLMILRERSGSALLTALVVLGAVVGYTMLQTPIYQATNRVFVQTEAGTSVADLSSGVNFASQQITSYADLATTPLVLEPVTEQLGLATSPQSLAEQISTTVPPETLILEITAASEDSAQAAAIANATSESLQTQVAALESNGGGSTVELTVISPATEPTSQASPNVLRNLAVGFVLAVLAGVGMTVVRDLLDNRVRRPDDIENAFDRAVVAAIPASSDAKHLPLIAAQHPQSIQAEAYRELRTNLQFMGLTEEDRSVLFTSSLPGEGKSSSAINLAHVMAQSGNRVLLIDADLRRPSVAKYLGLEGSAGLTTVLIGEASIEDVSQPLETNGLDVLTSGPIPPNPSELLGSNHMEDLLRAAKAMYDFVVVDATPLLAVTDAVVLSRIVGGTVVVAQSERVTRNQLAQALEKLDAVDARLLGVALNRLRSGARGGYSYQYTYRSETGQEKQRRVPEVSAKLDSTAATPHNEAPATSSRRSTTNKPASRGAGRRRAKHSTRGIDASAEPKPWPGSSDTDIQSR